MAVYKQNNKYYYRGKYKNALGEYVQYNRLAKGARLKKEAQRMEEIFILFCQNKIEALTSITFEELTKMYVDYAAKKVKSSSLKTDNYLIGKINKDIGLYKVNMLDKYTLQKYVDNFYYIYSYTYSERLFYVLKKVYKYAVTIGLVNNNPMDNVILSTNHEVIKDDINYWTLNQFNIFIGYVDYGLYYVIYNFLYYMGCRKGEALALQWSDVDLKNGKVNINKTIQFNINNKPYVFTTPKSKNSVRIISIPKKLMNILSDWKKSQQSDYYNLSFVFGSVRPLPLETLRRHFKNDIKIVNEILKTDKLDPLPDIRIHDLRHSHASYLINKKMYDYDIARRLGDTVATLHATYAHWFDNAEDDIMRAMNDEI